MSTLVLGDSLLFLIFATLGRMEHRMELDVAAILATAVPFIVSWVLVGYFLGAYSERIMQGLVYIAKRITLIWLIAGPMGIVLRAILLQIPVSLLFAGVTLGLMWIVLLAWRLLFTYGINYKHKARQN